MSVSMTVPVSTPDFYLHDLSTAAEARDVVIVIDVLRAFTTAAVAFDQGVRGILCVGTVDEALAARAAQPGSLVAGEIDGYGIPEFDFNNSPARMAQAGDTVRGRTLIQRTTAGTQGLIRAVNATHLFAASLVTAGATVALVRTLQPREVHFIATGITADGRGDEDVLCAEVIRAYLEGRAVPGLDAISRRIRDSKNGQRFTDPLSEDFPPQDLAFAARLNAFPFALVAERRADGAVALSKKDQPMIDAEK